MAEVNGNNKRPQPQEHAKKTPPPGFYVDFPDILRIEERDLMQPDPPLSFKDWPRCMQLGLIASLLPLMRSESDPEARTMILRYREVRELDMNTIWDAVDGPDIRRAQLENKAQSMNLQRISRAIRSWQTLHAKVAGKVGGRDVGRLLAKFLLDCLIFCRLKWPEAGGFPQIPLLSQLIRDTMNYLKETAWTETNVSNALSAPISTTDSSFIPRLTAGTLKDPMATNTVKIPTPQNTDDGARYPGEESHGDFVSLVKACVVSQPEGAKLLDHMVSNLHVKKAAYKLLELPKLLSRSKFKWQRTGGAGILLHGPPGTGKTSLAEAMAFQARHTLIKVPASLIRSRFVGNSEKIMRAVFEVAEAMNPSIVFIDEFDHLGSNREAVGGEKSKELKSEFLAAWSECNARGANVTVIGATNLPWTLDEAMISRFTQVLHVPLPNHDERAVLLQSLLSNHWHCIGGNDWGCLSKSLEGKSGRDIVNMIDEVIMSIGEEMFEAQLFERQFIATLNEHLWVPSDLAKKGNTVQKSYTSLDPSEAHPKQITKSDIMSAIKTMGRVSVSSNTVKHHEAFALRHGKGN